MHSIYVYVLCKSLNTSCSSFHDSIIVVLYYCILFHCMGIYLAALLLMEVMFFAVVNLMNVIKMNILICTSLCIFISFSKVSTGSWDYSVCGMYTLNFDCAIWALEWLYQFSWQASSFCYGSSSSTLISILHYLLLIKVFLT